MKKNIIFTVITAAVFAAAAGCAFDRNVKYDSLEELASAVVESVNNGDPRALERMVVDKKEFIEKVHPYTPEGKVKGGISGKDMFEIFIEKQREYAINRKSRDYRYRVVRIDEVGSPEKIIDTGQFKILRKVPVTLEVLDEDDRVIVIKDADLLGAVIKTDRSYRLLNMFYD